MKTDDKKEDIWSYLTIFVIVGPMIATVCIVGYWLYEWVVSTPTEVIEIHLMAGGLFIGGIILYILYSDSR